MTWVTKVSNTVAYRTSKGGFLNERIETPVKQLVPLLWAAHDAGAKVAAEANAKVICATDGRAEEMCGAWALALQYLPDGDLATRCIKQILHRWFVWSELAIPKSELDFRTMYRMLHKLPQDQETASAAQYVH